MSKHEHEFGGEANGIKHFVSSNSSPKKHHFLVIGIIIAIVLVAAVAMTIAGLVVFKNLSQNKTEEANGLVEGSDNSEFDGIVASDDSDAYSEVEESDEVEDTVQVLQIDAIPESTTSIDRIDIQQIEDKITAEGEQKQYDVTSTEAGTYRFEFSDIPNNICFRMYLYNGNMEELKNEGYLGNGDGITYDLEANTQYYLVVKQQSNVGSYKLNFGTQKPMVDVSSYTKLDDSIQFTGQRNKYAFTSTEVGTYRFEFSDIPNDINFRMYLYNSNMEELENEGYLANGDGITTHLEANTQYYLVVEQQGNVGSYTLNIGCQKYITDISVYTEVRDCVQFSSQRNTYSYIPSASATYDFVLADISEDTSYDIDVFNSYWERLTSASYCENGDGVSIEMEAGSVYYITVAQNWSLGRYTLQYGVKEDE